jgi:hypothetical protein
MYTVVPVTLALVKEPKISDGAEPRVVHQVRADVIANALQEKDAEHGYRDHRPDVVDGGRDEAVEVEAMVEDGVGVEEDGAGGGARIEDLI